MILSMVIFTVLVTLELLVVAVSVATSVVVNPLNWLKGKTTSLWAKIMEWQGNLLPKIPPFRS